MSQTPPDSGQPQQGPPDDAATPQQPRSPLTVQPPIRTGVTLGRFQVQEYIGQGAYGPNYRAYDPDLSRSVTIEVLDVLRDQDVRDRLAAAAPRLVQLTHPNLVDVYEVGERQGVPYLVSAYVEGASLKDTMRTGMSQDGALRVLQGVARGVDHAHWQGIVHGDLRPPTIILGAEGRPLVRDAGLVPLLDPGFRGAALGIRTGALHYEAPEQLDRGEVSAATDRYAFTTIAYELLTGAPPFPGTTTSEILSAKETMDPIPASQRSPQLGPATDAVLASGLARDPDARWQSCAQIVQALSQALHDDALQSQAAYAAQYPAEAPVGRAAGPARGAPQRWPWLLAALAGLVLLGVAGLLYFLNSQPPTVTLSPANAMPGDAVIVDATHLPANQVGTIQFESTPVILQTFRVDSSGNARERVIIPRDATPGAHTIRVCWAGSCPATASAQLTIQPTPTPTPAATPTPTLPPTPTPAPTPTPTPPPTPTPTPTKAPTPTPTTRIPTPAATA